MDEKRKVESDPEKGGFSPPLQELRRDPVGPAPTDDPRGIVNRILGVVSGCLRWRRKEGGGLAQVHPGSSEPPDEGRST